METIDDTGFGGIRLIQDTEGFRYGIDAVLLSWFAAEACPGALKAAELGSGNGIVSLLLAHQKADRRVWGIDFQREAVELAERSCRLNGLEERVSFRCCDIMDLRDLHPHMEGTMDLVVSNPPYIPRGGGIPGTKQKLLSARQETTARLDDFVSAAAWLLKGRGVFCMVHRPSRLVDIFCCCREHHLEPKRVCFVHPKEGEAPNIVLVQCLQGGGREIRFDDPIYVRDSEGAYTQQILRIYGKTE